MPLNSQNQRFEEADLGRGRKFVVTRLRDQIPGDTALRLEVFKGDEMPKQHVTIPARSLTQVVRALLDMSGP